MAKMAGSPKISVIRFDGRYKSIASLVVNLLRPFPGNIARINLPHSSSQLPKNYSNKQCHKKFMKSTQRRHLSFIPWPYERSGEPHADIRMGSILSSPRSGRKTIVCSRQHIGGDPLGSSHFRILLKTRRRPGLGGFIRDDRTDHTGCW